MKKIRNIGLFYRKYLLHVLFYGSQTNNLEGQDEGDCTELIPGGDMENGVSGWKASFGARIRIRPEGANGSQQSLEVYRRNFRGLFIYFQDILASLFSSFSSSHFY